MNERNNAGCEAFRIQSPRFWLLFGRAMGSSVMSMVVVMMMFSGSESGACAYQDQQGEEQGLLHNLQRSMNPS